MKFLLCLFCLHLKIFTLHIDHITVSDMKILLFLIVIDLAGKLLVFYSGKLLIQTFQHFFCMIMSFLSLA